MLNNKMDIILYHCVPIPLQQHLINLLEVDNYNRYQSFIGLLAGLRPCGIIVLLAELFTAESKAQVYGSLHEFFRKNPIALNNIGKSHPYQYLK